MTSPLLTVCCTKRARCEVGEALYQAMEAAHIEAMYLLSRALWPWRDMRPSPDVVQAAQDRYERAMHAWQEHGR